MVKGQRLLPATAMVPRVDVSWEPLAHETTFYSMHSRSASSSIVAARCVIDRQLQNALAREAAMFLPKIVGCDMSKHALHGYLKSLHSKLAPTGSMQRHCHTDASALCQNRL